MSRRFLFLVAVVAVASGCVTLAPNQASTAPAGPPELGLDWGRTPVERPANFQETVPPSYRGVHPILRIAGQATMADVVGLRTGGFVAIGYVPPVWQPVAWSSSDGADWSLETLGTSEFTFPVALATGADGTVAAVGRSKNLPVAWTTTDGIDWDQHAVPMLGDAGVAERMTSVVGTAAGFVAGGSAGPELFERHARFWTSRDGVGWEPVPDDPVAFENAEVRAITTLDGGYVAVGVVGTAQHAKGAVAWTSSDGVRWTRIDDPALEGGIAAAVIAAPFGGLVAVGSDLDRRNAVAWTSSDGRTWRRAPDEPTRQLSGGYAWLTDVVAIGDLLIAVGDVQSLQRGTAMAWISHDGQTWQRSNRAPVQEGAEFYAIAPGGPGAIAVGAFGAPDSYVPQVWLTPAR